MSVQAMTWAWEQELPMGPKAVLVAIANHADGDGLCHPGQARLARMVGCNERSIRTYVIALEAAGLVERKRRNRKDGSRTSDQYQLLGFLPAIRAGSQPANGAGRNEEPTGKSRRAYRQTVPGLPANHAGHEPSVEPSEEPSVENQARKRAGSAFDPLAVELPTHVDPDAWADFATHRREIRKALTPTATRRLVALLSQHPRDATAMLRRSVENSWTGVFPIDDKPKNGKPPVAHAPDHYTDVTAADLLAPGDVNGRWNN
jgi:hypothetical protein